MATIKSYSDLQQSKKLAEILPLESADMCYLSEESLVPKVIYNGMAFFNSKEERLTNIVHCWSLAALLNRLPFPILYMEMVAGMILWCCECHFIETDEVVKIEHCDNPVDACFEMILKLHGLNLL